MEKLIKKIIICGLLTGCAAQYPTESKLNEELSAWQRYGETSDIECYEGHDARKVVSRKNIIKYSECENRLAQAMVRPHTLSPALFDQHIEGQRKIVSMYERGKIDKPELIKGYEQNFNAYLANLPQPAAPVTSTTDSGNGMALLNLGATWAAIGAMNQPRQPVVTNCVNNPMGVSCTTY